MNFFKIISALSVSLAIVSCQKASVDDGGLTRISATCESCESKTVLSGLSILWNPGDKINVFSDEDNALFTSTNTSAAARTDFVGKINMKIGSVSEQTIYALYPYSKDARISDGVISTAFRSHQMGVDGSFGIGNMMSVAKSENWDLKFANVCGALKFSLAQEGVKGVVFKAAAGESLAGKVKISFDVNDEPEVNEITEAVDSLVIYAPDGGSFKTGTNYYVTALPCTLSGYTMSFYTVAKSAVATSTKELAVGRNTIVSLGVADSGLTYVDDPMASLFDKVNTTDFEW